jgi:hypothetical protein
MKAHRGAAIDRIDEHLRQALDRSSVERVEAFDPNGWAHALKARATRGTSPGPL